MTFSDETLMAYADEELEPAMRASVEQAMASDPELARRIAAYRALRTRLQEHYAPVLREPVPERLRAALRNPAVSNVVPLQPRARPAARAGWQLTALAASIALGVLIGAQLRPLTSGAPLVASHGQLIAHGTLAAALSQQLASEQGAAAPVRIGISYLARSGEYCRTFVLHDQHDLAGIACREPQDWRLQMLERGAAEGTSMEAFRQAASSMPEAVRQAVESDIAGEPLDARAEAAVRRQGWRGSARPNSER